MPRRPDQNRPPRAYIQPDGRWPAGPWQESTPVAVEYAAEIAANLERGITQAGLTIVEAARRIGLARRTLHAVIAGDVMPDLRTVALAEQELGVQLWPARFAPPGPTAGPTR